MNFLKDGSEVAPIDVDVFLGAYEYASMVTENEFLEEIPALKRFKIADENKGVLQLTNNHMNRFGLALARHFESDEIKMISFMFRFWALQPLLDDPRFAAFVRQFELKRDIHRTMIEVACQLPLGANFQFDPQAFLDALGRLDPGHANAQ